VKECAFPIRAVRQFPHLNSAPKFGFDFNWSSEYNTEFVFIFECEEVEN